MTGTARCRCSQRKPLKQMIISINRKSSGRFSMEQVEGCSNTNNRPIMQVPATLEGGVYDGLILKGEAGAGGHRVRNDGLEIGQIRALRWEGWESSDQRAKWTFGRLWPGRLGAAK